MATGRVIYTVSGTSIALSVRGFEHGVLFAPNARWQVRGTSADDRFDVSQTMGGSFRALAGDDAFRGSRYDDTFNGGDGTDHSLRMGAGNDTCISVEIYTSTTAKYSNRRDTALHAGHVLSCRCPCTRRAQLTRGAVRR